MAIKALEQYTEHTLTVVSQSCERFGFDWPDFVQTLANKNQEAALEKVFSISQYVADVFPRDAEFLSRTILDGSIEQPLTRPKLEGWLADLASNCSKEEDWHKALRILRRRAMVHIIWCDLLRIRSTLETTAAVSALADVAICSSLEFLTPLLEQRHGKPMGKESGQYQQLQVLGMGKLGGYELNLSSDIDLIYFYPETGDTTGNSDGKKSISNQEFFTKLGQKLISALDKTTVDGFVFRTDMRLRPWGESGPLVMHYDALENYLQTQGRDWERYAMIKARVLTGETSQAARELLKLLRPFTYRAYLDFSALESLRDMKAMINAQVRQRQLDNNIKLGPGGIREIEFIGQAFQMIRGGQEKDLQMRELIPLLTLLAERKFIPSNAAKELKSAYFFLRDTEHALQALNDQQTQTLPDDEIKQQRLALAMNFQGETDTAWQDFQNALNRHREKVRVHFDRLIEAQSDQKQQERTSPIWQHLWQGSTQDAEDAQLANLNPELIEQNFNETLQKLQTSRAVASLQPVARGRLDALMPRLLEELANTQSPSVTLKRVLPLIETVLRRSAYLLLLKENPSALKQLVQLCSYSPWLASYLTETPLLLDELLNQVAHQPLPDRASLDSELRQRLLRVEPDDLEQQMEQLRQFVRSHVFQAAACEVSHTQPLMLISGYLTNLAESCLTTVMQLAWEQMIRKYGQPVDPQGNLVNEPEFLVIGYGKVGGREMSYSSDLDLVFLHRGWMMGETRADREAGQRSVDIPVFYTRMGQRIIHILTTQTRTGELYEVDMRLRPSGNSGMIVASMKAFDDYQNQHAWTWEHQALVRARVLCGDPKLAEEFQAIRKNVLTQPRDAAELATQVGEMRDRMRTHLGSGKQPERPSDDSPDTGSALEQACSELKFHLKQDAGGIVDIEFLVQYGVLAWAHKNPELLDVTDNVRLLKALSAAGLLDPKDRQTLQDSYLSYRAETHRRALQHRSITLEPHESRAHGFDIRRYRVMRLWDKWLSADSATERTKPQDKSE